MTDLFSIFIGVGSDVISFNDPNNISKNASIRYWDQGKLNIYSKIRFLRN